MGRTRRSGRTIGLGELVDESAAGLMQRPMRSVLTALGTVLGIGAFVAVLGLTSTANGQISKTFDSYQATQVDVAIRADRNDDLTAFPDGSEPRVAALRGVEGVAVRSDYQGVLASRFPLGPAAARRDTVGVSAVSASSWHAVAPTVAHGRLFDEFLGRHRVAVLGAELARSLGFDVLRPDTGIYLNGTRFSVVGVISGTKRQTDLTRRVIVPLAIASTYFGRPSEPERMMVVTAIGAGEVVADQVPLAVDPYDPDPYQAQGPPVPKRLANQVTRDLRTLFYGLAAITLIVGAVGIANTTLVSVLERVPEIGLRRSLGAQRRHVAVQFLLESTVIGAFGGVIGTVVGALVVIGIAMVKSWTTIIEPLTLIGGPLLGATIGLLAGAYPSLRAARIEPVEALRR